MIQVRVISADVPIVHKGCG